MSARISRISVAFPQKMFYGLKGIVLGMPGVGTKTFLKAVSEEKGNNCIVMHDKASNIEFIINCFINPKGLKKQNVYKQTSLSEYICLLVLYDVTSKASFDGVIRKYLEYEPMINKSYQFILLVGNKCDLEEYRELSNEDVESVAAQHNMIFIETSTLTGRNLDYVAKVIRVRAAQTMKRFQIQPTPKAPHNIIHEESESMSQVTDSLQPSLKHSASRSSNDSSGRSSIATPPRFPNRAELSPEYYQETPPPLPERGEDDESSYTQTPVQQLQGTQNETPSQDREHSSSAERQSSSQKRASSLIADLAQRPSVQKNLGAKFKEAYRHSVLSDHKKKGSEPSEEKPQVKPMMKTQSSAKKVEKKLYESIDLNEDKAMEAIEQEISAINQQLQQRELDKSHLSIQQYSNHPSEHTTFRSEISATQTQRYFFKEDDQFVPVVDTFLYDPQQSLSTHRVHSHRSRSHSPMQQISSRLSNQDFLNSGAFAPTTDPRLYSRNLKPIMFLAIEHETDFFFVEVYRDDTLNLLTERVLHQIKAPTKSKYIVKYIQAILEHEIQNFMKDLKNQLRIIEKRKLSMREALDHHFKTKIEQMKQQINTEKIKNNWTNPKNSIGRVIFAMPKGQPLTLHIHENDDAYDLAFYFILDNDLKKSKVQQIVAEIIQVQRNFKTAINHQVPEQNQQLTSSQPLSEDTGYIFKANFNCGNGRMVPVEIREGEDIKKCVHKIVLEHQLKYEQYVKMVKIITEAVSGKV